MPRRPRLPPGGEFSRLSESKPGDRLTELERPSLAESESQTVEMAGSEVTYYFCVSCSQRNEFGVHLFTSLARARGHIDRNAGCKGRTYSSVTAVVTDQDRDVGGVSRVPKQIRRQRSRYEVDSEVASGCAASNVSALVSAGTQEVQMAFQLVLYTSLTCSLHLVS